MFITGRGPTVILHPFGLSYQPNRLQRLVHGSTDAHVYGISALVDTGHEGGRIREMGVHTVVQPLAERARPGDLVPQDSGLEYEVRRLVEQRYGMSPTYHDTGHETGGRLITERPDDLSMGRFEQHEHHMIRAAERWEQALKSSLTDQNVETGARRIVPFLGGGMDRDNFALVAPHGPAELAARLDRLSTQVDEERRVGPTHGREKDWLAQGSIVPARAPSKRPPASFRRWQAGQQSRTDEARNPHDRMSGGQRESR